MPKQSEGIRLRPPCYAKAITAHCELRSSLLHMPSITAAAGASAVRAARSATATRGVAAGVDGCAADSAVCGVPTALHGPRGTARQGAAAAARLLVGNRARRAVGRRRGGMVDRILTFA